MAGDISYDQMAGDISYGQMAGDISYDQRRQNTVILYEALCATIDAS